MNIFECNTQSENYGRASELEEVMSKTPEIVLDLVELLGQNMIASGILPEADHPAGFTARESARSQ